MSRKRSLYDCVRRNWPLALALVILWAATAFITMKALEHEDHLAYTRDDAYIQMAMAKNVVEHGSWGVNPGEFNSTSSSPLWVVLLSGVFLFTGLNDMVPFALNVIFVMLVVLAAFFILRTERLSRVSIALLLAAIVIVAPLPPLVLLGMEHSLQILLAIVFVYLAAIYISGDDRGVRGRVPVLLLVLAPVVVLCRFESVFLAAIIAAMLLFTRRWLMAALLGGLSLTPIVVYGAYSLSRDAMFMPNSVVLKGNVPLTPLGNWISQNIRFIPDNIQHLTHNPLFLVMTLAAAVMLVIAYMNRRERAWRLMLIWNLVFIAATLLHFQTNTSQNYRYEAYLVSIGIIAIGVPVLRYIEGLERPADNRALLGLALVALPLAVVFLAPAYQRAQVNHRIAPQESRRIYEQQVQMGAFLDRYYTGAVVAANDIGAINFYADIVCVDLWGLGSNDIAKTRMEIRGGALFDEPFVLSQQQIYDITREKGTDIAMVYHEIFELDGESRIPDEWILVGRWQIYRYERDYWDKVSFYAVDPEAEQALIANLRDFSTELPVFVRQEGRYTESG